MNSSPARPEAPVVARVAGPALGFHFLVQGRKVFPEMAAPVSVSRDRGLWRDPLRGQGSGYSHRALAIFGVGRVLLSAPLLPARSSGWRLACVDLKTHQFDNAIIDGMDGSHLSRGSLLAAGDRVEPLRPAGMSASPGGHRAAARQSGAHRQSRGDAGRQGAGKSQFSPPGVLRWSPRSRSAEIQHCLTAHAVTEAPHRFPLA